jgi:hypothetical protein
MSRTIALAAAALVLAGCGMLAGGVTAEHLADGTWQLKCKGSLAHCLERADEICHDSSYKIVSASDDRDFYGPLDVPYEVRSSAAIVRCGTRGRPLFGGGDSQQPQPAAAAPASPPARACIPGATQACVGAGACPGGQSCLADGSGYSPCLCAAPAPAADAGAGAAPVPAPPPAAAP